jgi:ferredoxin
MRVRIDRDECISCATCWEDCPEVFEEGPDDGFSQIVEPYRVDGDLALGEVPDEHDCVHNAAADCPVEIIHVEQS